MALNTKGLQTFRAGLLEAIDNGVDETADQVVDTAKQLVPVDTGALQASIEKFGAGGTGERTVEAGQSLEYAPFIEWGTSRQAAQPFLTPAAERNRKNLPNNVGAQLKALEGESSI